MWPDRWHEVVIAFDKAANTPVGINLTSHARTRPRLHLCSVSPTSVLAGKIALGDEVLSIDGVAPMSATEGEASRLIFEAGRPTIVELRVLRARWPSWLSWLALLPGIWVLHVSMHANGTLVAALRWVTRSIDGGLLRRHCAALAAPRGCSTSRPMLDNVQ